ncbi:LOW QUALITY PROTEIN: hypothetical protein SETIT_7G008000v2 [Setaria italica]|uniref:D-isomer specific 2-hydroxyacid dehydrogenase catalytic domain-containing protein n=1 Tax=Setaria italica TaxID=4555 RepID=A0A368RQU1_SETIT|nr:LOW QUALITY PROTEIN: hypothetical protein SETIT_7G008000v2 [Setaria italica]
MHQRFRVLDSPASGEPRTAFLAAAAAMADPPRAAVVIGGGVARVDAVFLDAIPSIRCLISTAAGVDHIDLAECARRGVAVANSGTVYSADVADHAVGMLVDVLRAPPRLGGGAVRPARSLAGALRSGLHGQLLTCDFLCQI